MDSSHLDRRFDQVFRDYQRAVLVYFLRRTDRVTARDATADTFLVAWRRMDDMPSDEEVLPWLYGIARRVLANHRRSHKRFMTLGRSWPG